MLCLLQRSKSCHQSVSGLRIIRGVHRRHDWRFFNVHFSTTPTIPCSSEPYSYCRCLYAKYIGQITPHEFMRPYAGMSYREAIRDYWNDCPAWLMDKLVRYFEEILEEEIE
jgi:hypothetical protein